MWFTGTAHRTADTLCLGFPGGCCKNFIASVRRVGIQSRYMPHATLSWAWGSKIGSFQQLLLQAKQQKLPSNSFGHSSKQTAVWVGKRPLLAPTLVTFFYLGYCVWLQSLTLCPVLLFSLAPWHTWSLSMAHHLETAVWKESYSHGKEP